MRQEIDVERPVGHVELHLDLAPVRCSGEGAQGLASLADGPALEEYVEEPDAPPQIGRPLLEVEQDPISSGRERDAVRPVEGLASCEPALGAVQGLVPFAGV